jgi:hypothetical protein
MRLLRSYWSLTVASGTLAALMIVWFGTKTDLPGADIGVGLGVFFLGPLAVVLAALRLPIATQHPGMIYVIAILAFAIGLFLWILAAVNLGYLSP